ncbi:hypothetical protein [Phenylobacterium immobile]|uniref:hypothetical protein n=1 Tax=Phenylobacterium immobile TaxID=21 RepID=UPI000A59C56C|nr:hypothetical protein [Phenylobacterium immobile]
MGEPRNPDRHYNPEHEAPRTENQEPRSEEEILRDERQTERQAPTNADPGEPAGGE